MIVIRLNTPEQNGTSGSDDKRQRRYLPAHALPASAPAPQTNVEIKKMLGGIHEKRLSTLDKGVRGSDTHAVPGSSILLRVGRSRLCVVSFVDSSPFADTRRVRAHPPRLRQPHGASHAAWSTNIAKQRAQAGKSTLRHNGTGRSIADLSRGADAFRW